MFFEKPTNYNWPNYTGWEKQELEVRVLIKYTALGDTFFIQKLLGIKLFIKYIWFEIPNPRHTRVNNTTRLVLD